MVKKIYFFLILCILKTPIVEAFSFSNAFTKTKKNIGTLLERAQNIVIIDEYPAHKNENIILKNHTGSITVSTWNQDKIMLEANKHGKEHELPNTTVSVKQAKKTTTIKTTSNTKSNPLPTDYTLIIPQHSCLTITNSNGPLHVKDTYGALNLETLSGSIKLENIQGSVHSQAPKGSITLELASLPQENSIFLEARKALTVKLTPSINANLNAKTSTGTITSDVYITLDPITTKLNKAAWKRMKKTVEGTIGSGGAPITLDSLYGTIHISAFNYE